MEENDKNMEKQDLSSLRKEIDELDSQIVELLNQRAEVVVSVGQLKHASGAPIYSPEREQALFDRLAAMNKGPLPQETLQAVYRELISGSYALERPLRIGFLGPKGSFSHLASIQQFGQSVDHQPLPDIRAVFQEVTRGHCDYGMVPIENSLGGGIIETMDSFIETDAHVCAECVTEIHHNLLGKCAPEEIKLVASKPEVFAQCRNWLSTGLPGVDLIPVASSAKAAEMAAAETHLAAIGSHLAAELYNLKIIYANIEDNPNNKTRFMVIGKDSSQATGRDKTAILFTTQHKSGALAEVLDVFARHDVNLTNIDNRPSKRRNWEYYFFVDFDGHQDDENIMKLLEEVRKHCNELHVLGSFPRATEH